MVSVQMDGKVCVCSMSKGFELRLWASLSTHIVIPSLILNHWVSKGPPSGSVHLRKNPTLLFLDEFENSNTIRERFG